MSLLDKILGRSEKLTKPLPRRSDVYYLGKKIFIASGLSDIYGRPGFGEEVSSLSTDESPMKIGQAIIRAIEASQSFIDSPYEGQPEVFVRNERHAFQIAGVSGWNELDQWYVIPAIEVESGKVTLSVTQRCKAGGSVSFKGFPTYECPLDAEKIGEIVLNMINTEPMPDYVDDPSHT